MAQRDGGYGEIAQHHTSLIGRLEGSRAADLYRRQSTWTYMRTVYFPENETLEAGKLLSLR